MRIYIIGGGPSIEDMDLAPIHDKYVIGVNAAYRLGEWVNICLFADNRFFKQHKNNLEEWPNKKVTLAPAARGKKGFDYFKRCQKHAICFEPGKLAFPSRGANSGASAINYAIREGAKEVVLLGFDMQTVGGRHNYHNFHNHKAKKDVYAKFMMHFENIAKELNGVKVFNATPNSKLKCFPKVNLNNIL